jgi:hypothetical protein
MLYQHRAILIGSNTLKKNLLTKKFEYQNGHILVPNPMKQDSAGEKETN